VGRDVGDPVFEGMLETPYLMDIFGDEDGFTIKQKAALQHCLIFPVTRMKHCEYNVWGSGKGPLLGRHVLFTPCAHDHKKKARKVRSDSELSSSDDEGADSDEDLALAKALEDNKQLQGQVRDLKRQLKDFKLVQTELESLKTAHEKLQQEAGRHNDVLAKLDSLTSITIRTHSPRPWVHHAHTLILSRLV